MYIDAQTQLDASHAYTATGLSTNTYDLGAPFATGTANGAQVDPGNGEPLGLVLAIIVGAKVSGTTETYEFDLIQSASANLGTADILLQMAFTNALAAAVLVTGAVLVIPIPPMRITKRYIGTNFVGANTPTITVTSWIAPLNMIQEQRYYTNAIVIS
jgi:hypothetical protein